MTRYRERMSWRGLLGACLLVAIAATLFWHAGGASEGAVLAPAPAIDQPMAAGKPQTAVLSGGCFWGVQGVFEHVKGVQQVWAGYAGGDKTTATYEQVSSGFTGHAESVAITFDPSVITYGEILRIFFSVAHDPTQLDRQGPDVGPQYRSSIFVADADQQRIAEAYLAQLDKSGVFGEPIVTRVDLLKAFFPAEAYHQDFLANNPMHPYIVINDLPKIDNLKRLFPDLYRPDPVLTTAAHSSS